jgi:acetyl-CoA C-acetyltransferase
VAARQSGPLAFERAGVTPADVDVALVYDSYTITVLATLEALGFCAPGEGGAFCAGGRIGLGGALPVNPDGGGLSSNQPGMRGIFLVIEATRQLRRAAGAAQVKDAEIALVHGTGGMLGQRHSGVTMLLGRA